MVKRSYGDNLVLESDVNEKEFEVGGEVERESMN